MEANNLSNAEFKTRVIRMLKKLSEDFHKDVVSVKKDIEIIFLKSGMKDPITEMKNTLEGINS